MKRLEKKKSKAKDKGKGKGKEGALSNIYVEDSDEEQAVLSASLVPPGSVLLTDVLDAEEFDYDALKDNDDLELWVVRVPERVKPKHLANMKLSFPHSALTSQRIGMLEKKTAVYDVWSVHDDASDENTVAGGDEVLGLNCLVPRKKKDGKLFAAPKPIAHHIVVSAQPALPTPPPSSPDAPNTESIYKSPARYQHPRHLLKHHFMPTGAAHVLPEPAEEIDLEAQTAKAHAHKENAVEDDRVAKKKRKASSDTKKAKRAKTGS